MKFLEERKNSFIVVKYDSKIAYHISNFFKLEKIKDLNNLDYNSDIFISWGDLHSFCTIKKTNIISESSHAKYNMIYKIKNKLHNHNLYFFNMMYDTNFIISASSNKILYFADYVYNIDRNGNITIEKNRDGDNFESTNILKEIRNRKLNNLLKSI